MEERLAAGHFDERSAEAVHFFDDGFECHGLTGIEGISGIAPIAAEIAAGQADENARPASVRGFALNAVKDFVDDECVSHGGTLTKTQPVCKSTGHRFVSLTGGGQRDSNNTRNLHALSEMWGTRRQGH